MPAVSTFIIAGAAVAAGAQQASAQNKAGKAAAAAGRAGGQAAAINAGMEAGTLRFQGDEAVRVAAIEAESVRAASEEFRGSQTALAAASGFVTDSGTAEALKNETRKLAETDALAYLFDASNKKTAATIGSQNLIESGVSQAGAILQQGLNAQGEARSRALGTLVNTFGSVASQAGVQRGITKMGSSSPVAGGWNVGDTFKYGRE